MVGHVGVAVVTPIEPPVAVRAYAVPDGKRERSSRGGKPFEDPGPSRWTLVFDTETTLDPGQGLRVGAYQLYCGQRLRETGFFSLEDAVRRMTAVPARIMGLKDRGTLDVGNLLDISPDTVTAASLDNTGRSISPTTAATRCSST